MSNALPSSGVDQSNNAASASTVVPSPSGDAHPAVSNLVRSTVGEVQSWQSCRKTKELPSKHADDPEESRLGNRFSKLLMRRYQSLGSTASRVLLSPPEIELVNSVLGVTSHEHSAVPSSANASFEDCHEILKRQQEHIQTLQSMLPDVKARPSDTRIMELAERFNVPEHVEGQLLPLASVFHQVQQRFRDEVYELQNTGRTPREDIHTLRGVASAGKSSRGGDTGAARSAPRAPAGGGQKGAIEQPCTKSVKRPRQMDPCSGDQHPAAESFPQQIQADRCDGTHLAGEAGHTNSVAAVSDCLVVARVVKTPWCDDVAAGLKFFECVGNQKARRVNPFDSLKAGDLCVVVRARDNKKVVAVAEVQGPQHFEQTDRSLLLKHLQPGRHDEIQTFLGEAPSFNVVFFSQVYDCSRLDLTLPALVQQVPGLKEPGQLAGAPALNAPAKSQEQRQDLRAAVEHFLKRSECPLRCAPVFGGIGVPRPGPSTAASSITQTVMWQNGLGSGELHPAAGVAERADAQPVASNVEEHVDKVPALLKSTCGASGGISSGGARPAASSEDQTVLWLVLEEGRYDAISSQRICWEGRPKDGTPPKRDDLRDPSGFDWKLARAGSTVILQRGLGTGAYRKYAAMSSMKIAQVRIFSSAYHMLTCLDADLLPTCPDPIGFYKNLYGQAACANAFVAMRFEGPAEQSL